MHEIHAQAKTIDELLNQKYAVDSYQREYKWGNTEIHDLISDLVGAFDNEYRETHTPENVIQYGQYFLGPIIVSELEPIIVSEESRPFYVVDGQQRLTSLTLLLMYLKNSEVAEEHKVKLHQLILSQKFNSKKFNLNIPERTEVLEKLFAGEIPNLGNESSQSVRNLIKCYQQISDQMDAEINNAQLPLFVEWLIHKVYLVEIRTASSNDAYAIFETMNDRGLRLTPAEMLKGYLLSEISDDQQRKKANKKWKENVDNLIQNAKTEESMAIKAWLRGQYADKMSDFEEIGAQFHRWVRRNENGLGLTSPELFANFITKNFTFYANWFLQIYQWANKFDAHTLPESFYLGQHNFTLQYPVLLSALSPEDSESENLIKLKIVGAYLDIAIHRRIGTGSRIAERSMRDPAFSIIGKIRHKSPNEIADLLSKELAYEKNESTLSADFALHGTNRNLVQRILARITDYIETRSADKNANYLRFFVSGNNPFEIEHIWRRKFDGCRQKEFVHESDFVAMRNRIGGLLLLPKSVNASLSSTPYGGKLEAYAGQNLLAKSLHENCYKNNPRFIQFRDESGVSFTSHPEFNKKDLEARQKLYRALADKIWHPRRLHEAAGNGN